MRKIITDETGQNVFTQECAHLFAHALRALDAPEHDRLWEYAEAINVQHEPSDLLAAMASFIQQVLARTPQNRREAVTTPLHTAIDKMLQFYADLPADIPMPAEWVDLFSWYANHHFSEHTLLQIHAWMNSLVRSRPEEFIAQQTFDNPASPWRILLFNQAIVATRTNQPDLIRSAYARIAILLPREAKEFFAQAMEQMDLIGYPDTVRKVVQEFYQRNQHYDPRH